jgi:hypothetical protein
MLVVVGHGPSIVGKRLGSWLDQQTVIRLKHADRPTAEDWGTRTDYVCASSPSFWTDKRRNDFPANAECWVLSEKTVPRGTWKEASKGWLEVFRRFDPEFPKPSTGLKAIFCAMEFLDAQEIGLIGFDRMLHPDVPTSKWWHQTGKFAYGHDAYAENRCLKNLPIRVVDLSIAQE